MAKKAVETPKQAMRRVETELRTFIEAGLESGELVLDEMQYGFDLAGRDGPKLEGCSVCLLGAAVRCALAKGKKPVVDRFGFYAHIDSGGAALGIERGPAQALEAGFMNLFRDEHFGYQAWFDLGARIRANYYSSWVEVRESGKPGPETVPSVTNIYGYGDHVEGLS